MSGAACGDCGSIDSETTREGSNANQLERDVMEQRSETRPRYCCICGVIIMLLVTSATSARGCVVVIGTPPAEVCRARREIYDDGVVEWKGEIPTELCTAAIPASLPVVALVGPLTPRL